ncbi:MAG: hypothetical protein AAGE93_23135 [Bacteroidota bacterium]
MEDNRVRLRITWNAYEVDIEGPQQFIESCSDTVKALADILVVLGSGQAEKPPSTSEPSHPKMAMVKTSPVTRHTPSSFGDWYYKVPKTATKTDIVLLASYFIQLQNTLGIFTTGEVNKLLREVDLELKNVAHFIKLNQDYRKVVKIRQGQFKVNEEGIRHLQDLELI